MAQNTFALMTNLGRAKEAAAIANGTAVVVTHIAIGDGLTVPSGGETALYHEVARKAISGHGTVVGASNVAYFDIFLEAAEGPYTIREAGLIDQDGDLIAIARYDPPINKPIPSSGQTVEGTIRLEVAFSNIANITIVVDPSFKIELQRLARLPWVSVISMSETAPPTNPAVGDMYLVASGATGAWSGQAGKVAEYTSAGWGVISPPEGHGVSLPDGRVFEKIGGAYVEKIAVDAQSGKWSYAAADGSANALTATLLPTPPVLSAGLVARIAVSQRNTGAATLNLNGLGAKPIYRRLNNTLMAGDLGVGLHELIYDGAAWRLGSAPIALTGSMIYFASPGSVQWVCPPGISRVKATVTGGGGAGAHSAQTYVAGAGAAGASAIGYFEVIPGTSYSMTVGAGGTASTSVGGTGGTSSFASFATATGGGGGECRGASGCAGGASGTASGGTLNMRGGWGGDGNPFNVNAQGGHGGASFWGGGARASLGNQVNASSPGSGGGGGWGGAGLGGDGANGIIVLEFV